MDTPGRFKYRYFRCLTIITEMQCIFFLMFQHAESAKMPLVTLLKKLLADNGIFKMPDVHMLGYHWYSCSPCIKLQWFDFTCNAYRMCSRICSLTTFIPQKRNTRTCLHFRVLTKVENQINIGTKLVELSQKPKETEVLCSIGMLRKLLFSCTHWPF